MARSILEPDLLLRVIGKKKQQLGKIERDLENLPLDHADRHGLFELREHLRKGIPDLEAEYAKYTDEHQLGSGDSHSHDRSGRATRPDEPLGKTGIAAPVLSKAGAVSRGSAKKPPEDGQHASADGQNQSSLAITGD